MKSADVPSLHEHEVEVAPHPVLPGLLKAGYGVTDLAGVLIMGVFFLSEAILSVFVMH
jgi:hypothetical protein